MARDLDPISIRGARQHNLQGVDLDLPRNRLVVFTGVSGSGKSSLAFDTLYAEGQRRYVESLSAYARQFLGQMDKPRYDAIRGLTPTIAVSQRVGGRNPRSTVGTMTEILDYLRVLFARAGVSHCPDCGRPLEALSAAEIVLRLAAFPVDARVALLAPMSLGAPPRDASALDEVRKAGFTRILLDGEILDVDDVRAPRLAGATRLDLVVDRVLLRPGQVDRLTDSVETALRAGQGRMRVALLEPGGGVSREEVFTEKLACDACGVVLAPPGPAAFSFNSPAGACPDCGGLGFKHEIDPRLVVPDEGLTLHQGAIVPWKGPLGTRSSWNYTMIARLAQEMGFDLDTPWRDLPLEARQALLYGNSGRVLEVEWEGSRHRRGRFEMDWEGCIPAMERRIRETKSEQMQAWYMEFMSNAPCGACGGSRLRRASMAVRIGEAPGPTYNLVELCGLSIHALHAALGRLRLERSARVAEDLLRETNRRVRFLEDVGVGYLSLDRGADTLSGGETQRIRLASQLGGELCGVTYVLDEPTIGLHPRDTGRFLSLLARLRDLGNTVVVVEHDRDTIEAADFVADFGPGAGREGGRLVFAGPPEALVGCMASLTGRHLAGALGVPLPERRRTSDGRSLRVIGAREHNLAGIDVFFPLGLMVAVTGVSGAGKSTLVHGILSPALHNALHRARRPVGACDRVEGVEHLTKIIEVDQAPIGRSPRSNPATYTGLFDLLRELLAGTREARARGFGPARFSFNQKGGRCEACSGDGQRRVEMHFLPDVFVRCEVCGGSRFNESTLAVRFRGLNIAEILDMSVDDALPFFEHHPEIHRILETLRSVGLGYVSLGQPSNTLSGGEAQRIKLSRELARVSRGDTLYLLDEPTTGLHFEDTRKLLDVLSRLVDAGNTVLLVEHNLDAVKVCDHVIDLGPEGGAEGGHIVAQGTPEEIIRCAASHTGRALQRVLLR